MVKLRSSCLPQWCGVEERQGICRTKRRNCFIFRSIDRACYGKIQAMETLETREVFSILTVLWFCVMCFFTFQPGPGTIAVSGRLTKVVESVIGIAFYTDDEYLERQIRFLAHPIEFAVLTVLTLKAVGRSGTIIGVVALILWSIISEVLKVRIPGRHCNGIDMVGNIIGVGVGVLLIVLV